VIGLVLKQLNAAFVPTNNLSFKTSLKIKGKIMTKYIETLENDNGLFIVADEEYGTDYVEELNAVCSNYGKFIAYEGKCGTQTNIAEINFAYEVIFKQKFTEDEVTDIIECIERTISKSI
jgi:hypothetical protein